MKIFNNKWHHAFLRRGRKLCMLTGEAIIKCQKLDENAQTTNLRLLDEDFLNGNIPAILDVPFNPTFEVEGEYYNSSLDLVKEKFIFKEFYELKPEIGVIYGYCENEIKDMIKEGKLCNGITLLNYKKL